MKTFLWFMYNFGLNISLFMTAYILADILVLYKVNLFIVFILCMGLTLIWPKQLSREEFIKDDEISK